MKKYVSVVFVLLIVIVFSSIAFGYEVAYLTVDSHQFGEITIYVPINYIDGFFSFNDDYQLVNVGSSTITGYFEVGGIRYSCRWTSFSTAEYRYTSSGYYDWESLTIREYLDTNIIEPDVSGGPDMSVLVFVVIACLMSIFLVLMLKRSNSR